MARLLLLALLPVLAYAGHPLLRASQPSSPFIIGGQDSNITDFPYQVSLAYFNSHTCGGSILAPSVILTAAHCVFGRDSDPTDFSIRAGSSVWNSGGETLTVVDIVIHEDYDTNFFYNDLALLFLERDLTIGGDIQLITIADTDVDEESANCIASGWGRTDHSGGPLPSTLQSVDLVALNNAECNDYMSGIINILDDVQVCSFGDGEDKNVCNGDSGGPFVCDFGGSKQQIGVASFVISSSSNQCDSDYPAGWARANGPDTRDWIYENCGSACSL